MRTYLKIAAVLLSIAVLSVLVLIGYGKHWTGFQGYINTKGEPVPPKMLWDWMQLLVIPTVLAIAAFFLNRIQKDAETRLAANQQREVALQAYLTHMAELMLKEKLRKSKSGDEVRTIARARTLSVLREMDGKRKGVIVRFLVEAKLITLITYGAGKETGFPIIDLDGADLSGADLTRFNFKGAWFIGANLLGADFRYSQLRGAEYMGQMLVDEKWKLVWEISKSILPMLQTDALAGKDLRAADFCGGSLRGYDLSGTDLRDVDLSHVDMAKTTTNKRTRMDKKWWFVWKVVNNEIPANNLNGADLSSANLILLTLENANLRQANLSYADLSRAVLPSADFTDAKLNFTVMEKAELKGATFNTTMVSGVKGNGANLSQSRWRNAMISGCFFQGADLRGADFSGASLNGIDLSGADLRDALLKEVRDVGELKWDAETKWPDGFSPPESKRSSTLDLVEEVFKRTSYGNNILALV